jgi:hypothetical protein
MEKAFNVLQMYLYLKLQIMIYLVMEKAFNVLQDIALMLTMIAICQPLWLINLQERLK